MREETACRLAQLTSDFYAQVADSFSATRSTPWEGWRRVLTEARRGWVDTSSGAVRDPLDVAPGTTQDPSGVSPGARQNPSGTSSAASQSPLYVSHGVMQSPSDVSTGKSQDALDVSPGTGEGLIRSRYGILRVLDLACGNLRFERYLDDAIDKTKGCSSSPVDDPTSASPSPVGFSSATAYAFDSCDALARVGELRHVTLAYRHLDIVGTLLARKDLASCLSTPPCNLSVCFGFMHHLALPEHRAMVLRALVDRTRPGGLVALSFWQLSQSERLLAKAWAATEEARARFDLDDLGPGDYLLGWQGRSDVFRFCHDFSEDEIDLLSETVSDEAQEVARYSADGASGKLNRYLLLRRR